MCTTRIVCAEVLLLGLLRLYLCLAPGAAKYQCPDLEAWVHQRVAEQLSPWRDTGITEQMYRRTISYKPSTRAFTIEVVNGTVKGQGGWSNYLRRALRAWPFSRSELRDFKVVHWEGDFPMLVKSDPEAAPGVTSPAFANANNGHFYELTMPCQIREQFTDDFEERRRQALAEAQRPWRERRPEAIWRGALGCSIGCGPRGRHYFPENHVPVGFDSSGWRHLHWSENEVGYTYGCGEDLQALRESSRLTAAWARHWRVQLVLKSRNKTCGVDAGFTTLNEHKHFLKQYGSAFSEVASWMKPWMNDSQTSSYQYVINVGNQGYSDRSWRMFALGSVVVWIDTRWQEFYFPLLQPWVHFVPVKQGSSDLCEKLRWARAHPLQVEEMARRGQKFIEHCFSMSFVNLYVAEVARQLGSLWELGRRLGNSKKWNQPHA